VWLLVRSGGCLFVVVVGLVVVLCGLFKMVLFSGCVGFVCFLWSLSFVDLER